MLGLLVGLIAGYAGGAVDALAMRAAELVLVLPVLYVVLAARATLPDTLPASTVFALTTTVLTLLGWPMVARGVRAIVAREAMTEFAVAARAMGASPLRIVWHHLAPATLGFLRTQALQLVPAAILAETTLSFAGLGFSPNAPSWGTLLHDAADIAVVVDAPWLLAAAGAVVAVVLAINLATLSRQVDSAPLNLRADLPLVGAVPTTPTSGYNGGVPLDLAGIFPPVATPFVDDEVDAVAMRTNVERWMRTGLRGVLLLGTNGEAPLCATTKRC